MKFIIGEKYSIERRLAYIAIFLSICTAVILAGDYITSAYSFPVITKMVGRGIGIFIIAYLGLLICYYVLYGLFYILYDFDDLIEKVKGKIKGKDKKEDNEEDKKRAEIVKLERMIANSRSTKIANFSERFAHFVGTLLFIIGFMFCLDNIFAVTLGVDYLTQKEFYDSIPDFIKDNFNRNLGNALGLTSLGLALSSTMESLLNNKASMRLTKIKDELEKTSIDKAIQSSKQEINATKNEIAEQISKHTEKVELTYQSQMDKVIENSKQVLYALKEDTAMQISKHTEKIELAYQSQMDKVIQDSKQEINAIKNEMSEQISKHTEKIELTYQSQNDKVIQKFEELINLYKKQYEENQVLKNDILELTKEKELQGKIQKEE